MSTNWKNEVVARKKSKATALLATEHLFNQHIGKKDPNSNAAPIIADLLVRTSHSPNDLNSTALEWAVDQYVAAKVGPMYPRLLKLHQHLVASGATPEKPYSFEGCDRYGVAFLNSQIQSFAIQTQSQTYMVVLGNPKFECQSGDIHIRRCTPLGFSNMRGRVRSEFSELAEILNDYAYLKSAYVAGREDGYFQYKDGRDRGYLCSVEARMDYDADDVYVPIFKARDCLMDFLELQHVIFDLACNCDSLEDANEDNEIQQVF